VIYSSDLFTYNAKFFQTLSGEKWRSFASSLRSMLKLRSTVYEQCLWKEILFQQRIRHFKILQSIYFAYDVGIISSAKCMKYK